MSTNTQKFPDSFKRLHVLPRRFRRYGRSGLSMFEQLRGMPDTPRQAYIRAHSAERHARRPDAYTRTEPLFKGEAGRYEGFVIRYARP